MNGIEIIAHGAIAQVWLNRPDLRNAFDDQLIAALHAAFIQLGQDSTVRVIVLGGRGREFCAGADLHWMAKMAGYSAAENHQDALQLAQLLAAIYHCPKPVVARVHGACFAGGMGLAAACDVVVAASTATFCLSEVKLGLIPATISPYVIQAIGAQAARRYFLTAERFDAIEAQRLGLVHVLAAPDECDQRLDALLAAIIDNSPQAVQAAKKLVREISGQPIDASLLNDTAARIAQARASTDGIEGIRSFLEKRPPTWR